MTENKDIKKATQCHCSEQKQAIHRYSRHCVKTSEDQTLAMISAQVKPFWQAPTKTVVKWIAIHHFLELIYIYIYIVVVHCVF